MRRRPGPLGGEPARGHRMLTDVRGERIVVLQATWFG